MFKKEKDLTERSHVVLKKNEIKALKAQIEAQFLQIDGDSTDMWSNLFSSKSTMFITKLASRTVVYSNPEAPLVFDREGRSQLLPTIMLLWRFPSLLLNIIIHPPVSAFLLNGADLMAPGIINLDELQSLQPHMKVSVSVQGNPCVFAVGEANMSYDQIIQAGRTGRVVTILHVYLDGLHRKSGAAPNSGFTSQMIIPLASTTAATLETTLAPDTIPPASSGETLPMDMEGLVIRSLLLCLKYILKDSQLPMLVSTLWALIHKYPSSLFIQM